MPSVRNFQDEHHTRLFLDSVVDYAIISLNAEGFVSRWNSGAERLKGYTAEEIIGRHFSNFYTPDDQAAGLPATLLQAARDEGHVEHTGWRVRKDGRLFWGDVVISSVRDDDGTLIGFAKVTRDLTERKEAQERERELSLGLERANQLKSEFLANMSHEVRTPLNGIIGMLTMLMKTDLDTAQYDMAQTAASSSGALLRIVNDILDFSKVEAGKLELESIRFSPTQLVRDVRDLFELQTRNSATQLRLFISDAAPHYVLGDPGRLRQVLTNLVGNALKFTESGSVSISIAVEDRSDESVTALFAVTDTGVGIREEQRQQLFDAFSQGDLSTTRRYGGTGLGLTISQQLVELMGSTLSVDSTESVGSTFSFPVTFALPTVDVDELAMADRRTEATSGTAGGRALIVEDNEVNQKVASSFLQYLGYEVEAAVNGVEALKTLDREHFDVIFMDCHMPVMDGFETTRQIRALGGPVADTPIVALTASALPEERARCTSAGMDDFLAKPFSPEDLDAVLRRQVRHHASP